MPKSKNPRSQRKSLQRIYWFHPHFFNWMGGHQYILEVADRLQTQHHFEVIIVCAGLSPKAQQKFTAAHIQTQTLLGISTYSPAYWIFLPFCWLMEVALLKKKYKIPKNAIIISSMFPATFLARILTNRNILLCYEPFAFFYDPNFLSGFPTHVQFFFKIMKKIYGGFDALTLQEANSVITLSNYNKKWIERCYPALNPKNLKVAYEGVNSQFFKPTKNAALTKKYRDQKIIFHSTDYTKIKGTEWLIRALPAVKKAVPDSKLIISETLPDSPNKPPILELAKKLNVLDSIEFIGFAPYKLLPAYFSLAKVVVQPSIQQSMNMTVKEAMACGTAIITSPEGKEQTSNGEAGYLVNPTHTKQLAERIVKCLKTDSMVSMMGKKGRQIIAKKFSWEAVTKVFANELKAYE